MGLETGAGFTGLGVMRFGVGFEEGEDGRTLEGEGFGAG